MLWIRADAGKETGTGHVMRCLAIAREAARLGEKVCFLAADEATRDFLKTKQVLLEQGNPFCRLLGTDYRDMESELGILETILKKDPGILLVDSYFAEAEYLRSLKKSAVVAYLDDNHLFSCPADIIINYHIYAQELGYGNSPEEKGAQLLLGPRFLALRGEFCDVDYRVRPEVQNILLTTGGTDTYDIAGKIIRDFQRRKRFENARIHVVSGAMNPHLQGLQELAREGRNIQISSNVSDMASLMAKCDLAVTAGGSTLYELCAVGVPLVCFSFARNQERLVREFVKRELTVFGGEYLQDGERMIPELTDRLTELAEEFQKRESYSSAQRSLVDGRGARRIAEELAAWGRGRRN